MGQLQGHKDFNPERDIPSLKGRVIFVTGGTAGLGRESILAIAKHEPEHVYFTGRNSKAADSLIAEIRQNTPSASLTFLELDMTSLSSVKAAVKNKFAHDRLDVLMCNAGVMATPPGLSKDGFEIQFAINHLAHGMIIQLLLPTLLKTAEQPGADVRVVCLTSEGWSGHPRPDGIVFSKLRTEMNQVMGSWIRYGQAKLANVVYARELARRYPNILAVSIHPGVVSTGLVTELTGAKRLFVDWSTTLLGRSYLEPWQGCLNQLWASVGTRRDEIVNGAFYYPIGVLSNHKLDKVATSQELATKLWDWTNEVLLEH